MLQSSESRNSPIWIQGDEAREKVNLKLIQSRCVLCHGHAAELREGWFEIVQFQGIRPIILIGSSQDFEYFEDLVDFRITHEERPTLDHLREDATSGPEVDSKTVGLLTQKDLGASIPESYNFMCVRLNGESEGSSQTEVSQFDVLSCRVHQQVLRFQISVEDSVLVQVDQRLQDLV